MINLVISRSQQPNNKCIYCESEQYHCGLISEKIMSIIGRDDRFNAMNIPMLKMENDSQRLNAIVQMSNEFIKLHGGQGYHLSIHTDAGGYATGASGLYYSDAGFCFGRHILEAISKITPWEDVGMRKRNDLYELKHTTAVAFLLEISFHDNEKEARWIHDNIDLIASTICQGIYKGVDLPMMNNNNADKPAVPPIININDAIDILLNEKVITDKNYWTNAIEYQTNVEQLLINMAKRLKV